ncbi:MULTISPECIES: sugar ABC transporter substrate-binding protein [Nocardiaceae]|uniref:sugar ABC transporter substrate-binding protein n=1 Tax=Nocardiaceae TaxID=85025 RepID=UPI00069139EB|nr:MULTISPECIES: sugar ABC transporter substrate-binding protein [Rhodococcus]OZF05634.1 sugar ABC transporter substrate-binding protein [Rhodococcus sp. 15-1189-1-1a]OZF20416.1 sugar ABC transporter substrate-binding protein [Rhodococcus sp. 14-2686-1-2]
MLSACSSTGGAPESSDSGSNAGTADTPRATVAMITHAPPGDTFWDLIRKGAEAAAAKDNIELQYTGDVDAPNQANLVQNAIDSGVDGMAVTLAKPDAMKPNVETAVAEGIPVVAFNSGYDNWQDFGLQGYFGQDERIAGIAAGERMKADGATNAICVIQEQGAVQLEARCAGIAEGFGGRIENLNVNGQDLPSVQSTIQAKLQQDPSIDSIITLGAPIALTAVESVSASGSNATISTFDTNAALVDAIKSGDVAWAIDQQPYLQGYLAVDSLWLYLNNKNTIGGGQAVLTGPSFIDNSNIDAIADLAAAGTR